MKSSSNAAGILPLTGMAAVLEKAAADGDLATIDSMHPVFIKEWRAYKERLREYLQPDGDGAEEKEPIRPDMLKALLSLLGSAMEEMDIDGVDDAMKKLSSYRLPKGAADEFDALKAATAQLDQMLTADIIERINEAIE
ncbi:MAG: hypothetical protein K6G83_11525 [Lachnospiraceae bacterium]|nr:hypothetical protein [Lachnospiraceae bacterium]